MPKITLGFWGTAMYMMMGLICVASAVAQDGEGGQLRETFSAGAWEAGQHMFYTDPYWRGGDCASTVDLGDGRVLWLFADSYVGVEAPYVRDTCCVDMIRNCLGIQTGYNPLSAGFNVFWRGTEREPSAYFPGDDSSWYWPGNAVKIDSILVVFLMHVCPDDSGLGFRACGTLPHAAFIISDFEGNPPAWTVKPLKLPDDRYGIMLGAATIVEPPYLYMFNVKEPGNHAMYLTRWHTDDVLTGNTRAVEWWAGNSSAWIPDHELVSEPAVVFPDGATELSVVYDAKTTQYLAIQTVGFGSASVMMRTAPALTGPWSDLKLVYEPKEKTYRDVIIYAAKAHAEIKGADLIITYNTNGPDERLITDSTIYYPRLIRFDWQE